MQLIIFLHPIVLVIQCNLLIDQVQLLIKKEFTKYKSALNFYPKIINKLTNFKNIIVRNKLLMLRYIYKPGYFVYFNINNGVPTVSCFDALQ